MSQFKQDNNGTLADTKPLFASSLLALFYVLRENFAGRRAPVKPAENPLRTEEE